jgi:hypothetical protein
VIYSVAVNVGSKHHFLNHTDNLDLQWSDV